MKAILLLLLPALLVNAEVEYEIHTGYSSTIECFSTKARKLFPIVVTVTDENNEPIKGAIAAIKRIEPDGYTEKDVRDTKNSFTDKDGHLNLYCPRNTDHSDPKNPKLQILGAITVVADGYQTTAIEFEPYFAGMELPSDERCALAAHLVMKKK